MFTSSGSDDIKSYASVIAHCPSPCNMVLDGLNDLRGHINGTTPLSSNKLTMIRNVFVQFPKCLAENAPIILLGKSVVADYDLKVGVLFTTPNTQGGFLKDPLADPGLEVERAMIALQQGIFDAVFTPKVYADYPQHINGWKFNSCYNFPVYVNPPVDSSLSKSVLIRANFADPDGVNPYYDIQSEGMNHALRPTGLYLAPGSVVSVTVPDSLVGHDYYIRVGSHDWDLKNRRKFFRLDRISKKFLIDSTTIKVFNPLGGAISILVPYGADDSIVKISLNNGVEAPFFSLKSFYKTPDFTAELNKPGPWAVFETDNVMYTIPKHSIVPGQYNLEQTLKNWETAVRGMNSILARQIIPDKHNMYMIADLDTRGAAYFPGYPASNTPLNYTNVPGPAYFINGPGPDDEVNFHETGHALAISKFPGEVEAIVNFPYIMATNYGLKVNLNQAVKYSFVPNTFDIDKTAIHRMVSNTFGSARNISNTEKDEVRYQHRGYGHYFEIVNILGWCPLRNFWKQESIDFENGINHGTNDQGIDSRILRMAVAAQADLRPLFHVFGILPQDSIALQNSMSQMGINPSLKIYNRLQDYLTLIPQDNTAFVSYALSVYPNLYIDGPTEDPNYGVGWHYLKSLTYNAIEAQNRKALLRSIIQRYYPNGAPASVGNLNVCCLLDTLTIKMINKELIVTGGVKPYNISIDTAGNVKKVTVVDFDGCESTAQFEISRLPEENIPEIRIYPNPNNGNFTVKFSNTNRDNVSIVVYDMIGRRIYANEFSNTGNFQQRINLNTAQSGIYLVSITNGDTKLLKRIIVH
ncbi:MAG: T9SS type A sorting domain-containing protein [Ferruginibacter sp.]